MSLRAVLNAAHCDAVNRKKRSVFSSLGSSLKSPHVALNVLAEPLAVLIRSRIC